MTRKDYELIARTLQVCKPASTDSDDTATHLAHLAEKSQWLETCGAFADRLATTNTAFDRARFLKACGL